MVFIAIPATLRMLLVARRFGSTDGNAPLRPTRGNETAADSDSSYQVHSSRLSMHGQALAKKEEEVNPAKAYDDAEEELHRSNVCRRRLRFLSMSFRYIWSMRKRESSRVFTILLLCVLFNAGIGFSRTFMSTLLTNGLQIQDMELSGACKHSVTLAVP